MKTRIRKKEYNNGKIEYICEKAYMPDISVMMSFFSISLIFYSAYNFSIKDWTTLAISINFLLFTLFISINSYINGWEYIYNHEDSVFNTISDAQNLINEVQKKEEREKKLEYNNKTKKETIIKFP